MYTHSQHLVLWCFLKSSMWCALGASCSSHHFIVAVVDTPLTHPGCTQQRHWSSAWKQLLSLICCMPPDTGANIIVYLYVSCAAVAAAAACMRACVQVVGCGHQCGIHKMFCMLCRLFWVAVYFCGGVGMSAGLKTACIWMQRHPPQEVTTTPSCIFHRVLHAPRLYRSPAMSHTMLAADYECVQAVLCWVAAEAMQSTNHSLESSIVC
jgi:hypothetical protein